MNFFPKIITNSKFIPRYIIKNIFSPFACHHFFLSRLALALLAHFVSSLTALSKISTFFILPVTEIKFVGNNVLISTYLPLLKLFKLNSILFVSVA